MYNINNYLIQIFSSIPLVGWLFVIFLCLFMLILLTGQNIMRIRKYIFLIYKNKKANIDSTSSTNKPNKTLIYVDLSTTLQFPYIIDSGANDYIFTGEYWGLGDCIVVNENFSGNIIFDNVYIKVFPNRNKTSCYALHIKKPKDSKNISLINIKLIGENYFETVSKYSSIKLEKGTSFSTTGEGSLIALCGNLDDFRENLVNKKINNLNNLSIIDHNSTINSLSPHENIVYQHTSNKKTVLATLLKKITENELIAN